MGKLSEALHDPTCVQVVVSQTVHGEQLSMKDKDGILITSPTVDQQKSNPEVTYLYSGKL